MPDAEVYDAQVTIDGAPITGVTSVRVKRGRKTETGFVEPGLATVRARVTDPVTNHLGKAFVVSARTSGGAWEPQFTGYVTTQQVREDGHGAVLWSTFTARDESARLGGGVESVDPEGEGELPGARVDRILDAVGVAPGDRAVGPGRTPMAGTSLGGDLKRELDACVAAEFGYYAVSRTGIHVFYDSTQWHDPPDPTVLVLDDTSSEVPVAPAGAYDTGTTDQAFHQSYTWDGVAVVELVKLRTNIFVDFLQSFINADGSIRLESSTAGTLATSAAGVVPSGNATGIRTSVVGDQLWCEVAGVEVVRATLGPTETAWPHTFVASTPGGTYVGLGHRYSTYTAARDISRLANRVAAQGDAGYTAKRTDAASEALYGVQNASYTFKTDSPTSLEWLADESLANLKDSKYQITEIRATSLRGTLHDDAATTDLGHRIDWTRSSVNVTLAISAIEATWDPQAGWSWTWTGYEPWTVVPRYDPILSPAWNRYYMADGPESLKVPDSPPFDTWPEEYHAGSHGGSEGLQVAQSEDSLTWGTYPNGRKALRRDEGADGGQLSDFGNSYATLPATGAYTVTWIGVLAGIPARNSDDLRAANVPLSAVPYSNTSQAYQYGFNVNYQGQTPQTAQLAHRPTDNGAWTGINITWPIVGGTGGDAGIYLEAVYTTGSGTVRYQWHDGTSLQTGLFGLGGTPSGTPTGSVQLPFLAANERNYVFVACVTVHNGDMIQTPTAEYATWQTWALDSYGFTP